MNLQASILNCEAKLDKWGRLVFDATGMPAIVSAAWRELYTMKTGYFNVQLSTALEERPLISDLILFALWTCGAAKYEQIWQWLGQGLVNSLITGLAVGLSKFALEHVRNLDATEGAVMAPLPRPRCGTRHRTTDPVNRLVAAQKLKNNIKAAAMRWAGRSMQQHIVSKRLAQMEDLLHVLLYSSVVETAFASCTSVCLSWDGSSHQGKDTNVYIIFAVDNNSTAYLNLQTLHPIRASELAGEVDYKITRTYTTHPVQC